MKFKSGRKFLEVTFLVLLGWLVALILPPSAQAAGPWYVSNSGDDTKNCTSDLTACASINAVLNKPGFIAGDTVLVATGIYTGTGNEVVFINKDAVLSGGWDSTFSLQSGWATIDGQGARRGVTMQNGVSSSLSYFRIENGSADVGAGIAIWTGALTVTHSIVNANTAVSSGGGIFNDAGQVVITESTISGNTVGQWVCCHSGDGGGIFNAGTMRVSYSTVDGNHNFPDGRGSGIGNFNVLTVTNSTISSNINNSSFAEGIYNSRWRNYNGEYPNNKLTVNSSTIVNNSASYGSSAYGIRNQHGVAVIQNSLLANNIGGYGADADCYNDLGTVNSLGYNLIGINSGCTLVATDITHTDPLLGSLDDNGGATFTHALLQGSPALDAGNPTGCTSDNGPLTTDQRGLPRVGRCDIGAFEEQSPFSASMTVDRAIAPPGQILHYQIIPQKGGGGGISKVLVTDTLPTYITYLNNSLSATNGAVGYANGTITWNGSIDANQVITISYDAVVNLSAPGNQINNSAVIDGGSVFTRTVTTEAVSHFGATTKSVDRTLATPGDSLQYSISFNVNNLIEPTSVMVTDTLPTHLSYIPGSATTSKGAAGYVDGAIRWNATVNPGEAVTISFRAKISPSAPTGSSIVNSAILNGGGEIITRTTSTRLAALAFLPFASNNVTCYGICGSVRQNGAPVKGALLLLRFYDGFTWSTVRFTYTESDGSFAFFSVPSLASGQKYYVLYQNTSNNTQLSSWATRMLTLYTAGTNVLIGNFDIANILLDSPPPYAAVSLPFKFQWTPRSATTFDSYEFDLFDPNNPNLNYWTPPLGYVGSYTVNGLASGFTPNVQYGWFVGVYGLDGGYGISYYYRPVTFLNSGSVPLLRIPSKASPIQDDRLAKPALQLEGK